MSDKSFWDARYVQGLTGWDVKGVSQPLKHYIDQLKDRTVDILIPGVGYGHELEYLWHKGFVSLHGLDISEIPLRSIRQRIPQFPHTQLYREDFFAHRGQYDLILEQTFFCAIDPGLRKEYVKKMKALCKPEGKIAGVLFDFPLTDAGPPYGGDAKSYRALFEHEFEVVILEPCRNSIPQRAGRELFFVMQPKI